MFENVRVLRNDPARLPAAARREGEADMRYLAVLEPTATGYSAYLPDLPGCVAAGETEAETLDLLRRAVAMHLDGMREDGQTVPPPRAEGHILEVA